MHGMEGGKKGNKEVELEGYHSSSSSSSLSFSHCEDGAQYRRTEL